MLILLWGGGGRWGLEFGERDDDRDEDDEDDDGGIHLPGSTVVLMPYAYSHPHALHPRP